MLDWSCLHILTAELYHVTGFCYTTAHPPSEHPHNLSLSLLFPVLFPELLRTCAEHRITHFTEVFFMASPRGLTAAMGLMWQWAPEVKGLSAPQMCHRCGAVLEGSTAGRRQSKEGWHLDFQSQENTTDLNDPKKVSTGFRCNSEHSVCLKINFHMEEKQNTQFLNYHIINLCCIHI